MITSIGLSEARRAGIPLGKPNPKTTSEATREKAARDDERGRTDPVTGEDGQTKRGRAAREGSEEGAEGGGFAPGAVAAREKHGGEADGGGSECFGEEGGGYAEG